MRIGAGFIRICHLDFDPALLNVEQLKLICLLQMADNLFAIDLIPHLHIVTRAVHIRRIQMVFQMCRVVL